LPGGCGKIIFAGGASFFAGCARRWIDRRGQAVFRLLRERLLGEQLLRQRLLL
jgi:hypothetical protein